MARNALDHLQVRQIRDTPTAYPGPIGLHLGKCNAYHHTCCQAQSGFLAFITLGAKIYITDRKQWALLLN